MASTDRSNRMGATAVAERPTDAMWFSKLVGPQTAPVARRAEVPARTAELATGVVAGLPGAVTDMVLSADGRSLVAAHYGDDAISVIDVATLTVTATAEDIAEPYALAVADRVYASCAGIAEDSVAAIDTAAGVELAAKGVPANGRGLAVSPSGDTIYLARCVDDAADIAVIDVESGVARIIPVAHSAGATVDTVRVSPDGARLYAALTTESGAALLVIDLRAQRVSRTIAMSGSIGDIAVHRDGRRVVVTGWNAEQGGQVVVIDPAAGRVGKVIAVDGLPTQVVLSGTHAYVVHGDGDSAEVSVFDLATAKVVDRVDLGRPVSCVAVSRDGARLYVADYQGAITATAVGSTGAHLRAAS